MDGRISAQYASECRKNGCKLEPDLKEGDLIGVPQRYFEQASSCIFEIGVKLAQVLWRKLSPEQILKADRNLTEITYELIVQKDLNSQPHYSISL